MFKKQYKNMNELFKIHKGKKVFVLLNKGNKGDGLIHAGGRRLLKKNKVDYNEIKYPEKASGKVLFVYGCGAFCKPYYHMVEFVNFYMDHFKEIFILPSSFDLDCKEVLEFIKNLPKKVTVFCREWYSYYLLQKYMHYSENLYLDKDPAFYLDYSQWKKRGRGTLLAFRTDEPLNVNVDLKNNKDISISGNEDNWETLLDEISLYNIIHTNRVHVAIAATLMGKKTFIYPMSYHKSKGIYLYSLIEFQNVKWIENCNDAFYR